MVNGKAKKISLGLAALGGAAVAGAFALDLPPWAVRMAENWGPAFMILLGFGAGVVHYVPPEAIGKFVQAQQDNAVSMAGIKDSLFVISGQQGQLGEIKEMLSEVITHQHVNGERLKIIEMRLGDGSERRANDT